jgi:hypothetical protein
MGGLLRLELLEIGTAGNAAADQKCGLSGSARNIILKADERKAGANGIAAIFAQIWIIVRQWTSQARDHTIPDTRENQAEERTRMIQQPTEIRRAGEPA